ncbi:unnamed protein product [Protopolystoma xenopodis]|uniref:Secreted protein n=1 Tax=Protopolystoma xenopodis TaxID=117903 RepID=A0A448XK55_9PLAT|nr:unnamed protein product [Protopolystoma xenopodis]
MSYHCLSPLALLAWFILPFHTPVHSNLYTHCINKAVAAAAAAVSEDFLCLRHTSRLGGLHSRILLGLYKRTRGMEKECYLSGGRKWPNGLLQQ